MAAEAERIERVPAEGKGTLPYGSSGTFITTLDHFKAVGIPNLIDRNALPSGFSGSSRYEILNTLRFFGLIDANGKPNAELLKRLIEEPTRKAAILDLLKTHYAGLFALPLQTAGPSEVGKWFNDNTTQSTARKARAFFIALAKQSAVPMHKMVAGETRSVIGSVKRRRRRRNPGDDDGSGTGDTGGTNGQTGGGGTSKTVALKSGNGQVTLSVSVDVIALSTKDRAFVFDLIDRLNKYGAKSEASEAAE